jgi:hypothetical protein
MSLQQQMFRQPANGVASWQDAPRSTSLFSPPLTWRPAVNSSGVGMPLTSNSSVRAWPSSSMIDPAYPASRSPANWVCPRRPSASGGSVGAGNPSPWRTSRDRGAPRSFPPEQVAHVKAIACELPAKHGRPLSRFSLSEIVAAVLADDTITRIGRTTVWRILHQDGLRPWFHKTWIFPRDPKFRERAGPVSTALGRATTERTRIRRLDR